MKKTIAMFLFSMLLLTGSSKASPLDDYSKAGNFGISIYTMRADMGDDYTGSILPRLNEGMDFSSKWSWGGELSVTVAPKWALSFDYAQYKNKDVKESDFGGGNGSYLSSRLQSSNIKLKYQAYAKERLTLTPYLGVGLNKNRQFQTLDFTAAGAGTSTLGYSTKRKTSLMAGLTAVYALDREKRFKTYFDGALGNKMYSWNIGVSYELVKNLELDFGYKCYQVRGLEYDYPNTALTSSNGSSHVYSSDKGKIKSTSKGIYFGLSYKFR